MARWREVTWVSSEGAEVGGEQRRGGGEAVVGGEDEERAGLASLGEGGDVPAAGVGEELLGEGFGGAAGEGACRRRRGRGVGWDVGVDCDRAGGRAAAGHVGGGDEADGFDGGVVRAGDSGDHAAHAVADEDEVVRVGAEAGGVGGIAEVGDGGVGVFDGVGEGEVAGGAPGAAVVEEEDVVAGAAEGLGDVEIFFVAGEAVEEDDGGMRACSGGDVDEGVEQGAVAGELEGVDGGGMGLVGGGVGGDGGGFWARRGVARKRARRRSSRGNMVDIVDGAWRGAPDGKGARQ